ncbi:ParB/RepB/Spo0J family partition protein [Corynebacterium tapiri]|uniref:ParB/RepB/Spo0J family partition protein n=1 Tax=Corynebacterium tapiri TaxID=1448266 RepID=A0A5C4U2N9_9CORY|nr:ParB/RepB/Spo0J family partition protein [Corynebacterium tapiri]TNL96861.1 ParB/RepB/Spo0J family partition protein [Corynebacterium tapiri]
MADKPKKGGLGRGLGALIPSGPGPDAGDAVRPTIGSGAADVIFGDAGKKKAQVPGAPTFNGTNRTQPPKSMRKAVADKSAAASAAQAAQSEDYGARYAELPIGSIVPNSKNPRQVFDEDDLGELIHSIKEFGLLQPIVVRRAPDDDGYELIMGERRWRAASKAKLKTIPAIIRDTADEDMLRDALLENIHRVQLNPLEEAAAYQQLLEEFGVTQAELADRLGRSRPVITNTIRLVQLPVPVQKRVAAGVLSAGHARALLGVKGDEVAVAQEQIADRVVREGLSVRATEEAVTLYNRDGSAPAPRKRTPTPPPEFATAAAERLADTWDTRVSVTMGKRKGKIVVEFGDQDDFERIMSLIEGDK